MDVTETSGHELLHAVAQMGNGGIVNFANLRQSKGRVSEALWRNKGRLIEHAAIVPRSQY